MGELDLCVQARGTRLSQLAKAAEACSLEGDIQVISNTTVCSHGPRLLSLFAQSRLLSLTHTVGLIVRTERLSGKRLLEFNTAVVWLTCHKNDLEERFVYMLLGCGGKCMIVAMSCRCNVCMARTRWALNIQIFVPYLVHFEASPSHVTLLAIPPCLNAAGLGVKTDQFYM